MDDTKTFLSHIDDSLVGMLQKLLSKFCRLTKIQMTDYIIPKKKLEAFKYWPNIAAYTKMYSKYSWQKVKTVQIPTNCLQI